MPAETLRYATLTLSGIDGIRLFGESSAVSIETTRYLGPIENGQHVGLSDLSGDLDIARELLAASEQVLQYDLAGTDERGIVYAHYRSVGSIADLLTALYRNDIVLNWPIEHRAGDESAVHCTVIGTSTGIRRATAAIPDTVDLSVEQIGRFESGENTTSLLTDRQAALLALAVREGYYEVPRETTQRALADRLDIAPGTLGDRLQRIERRVMSAYAEESRSTHGETTSL